MYESLHRTVLTNGMCMRLLNLIIGFLCESGVKIYEYTPGFIHSKTYIADDEYGVVGTINMDFRSLYLHFECGVWMYKSSCIGDMKNDFFSTLKKSEQITLEHLKGIKWYKILAGFSFASFCTAYVK